MCIPVMDDPMGKYWDQPQDIRDMPMDDEVVLLRSRQVFGLAEYSASYPSGVYPGKCWRRNEGEKDFLVWYGDVNEQNQCSINYRQIVVVQ